MTQKTKLTFQAVRSRLNGISLFGFGANWTAPEPEQAVVHRVIRALEDRRVFYVPMHLEVPHQVEDSVQGIRHELTEALKVLPSSSPAAKLFQAMRASCRKFLSGDFPEFRNADYYRHRHGNDPREFDSGFFVALGELRASFGQNIAELSSLYQIDLEPELASILPPEIEEGA
ncbi:DUF6650 family protein [Amorphus sp. 3PC139-8]|uniref:DUF6650 family protein n=1 Tax=Amorphus sp. 3PC139-8 TaxID=2735676 RepID=UPI00345D3C2A